ncbi:hypothetical protein [Pseudomonas atacamensis]|uniref:hypothetical protein n=1 Tax=Pseudomonas atacamensis TaxID=2565368 RepID=UPI0019D054C5|nr:hypothetical protein [Pseudomonas atacamensis]QSL86219.1 hypothetical protein JWU58_18850 [Pseudomonas atacamensis]
MAMINDDVLRELNLPHSVQVQALKLLTAIADASTVADTLHAADRAEGFALGIETVKALNPALIESLYVAFDQASQARQQELVE